MDGDLDGDKNGELERTGEYDGEGEPAVAEGADPREGDPIGSGSKSPSASTLSLSSSFKEKGSGEMSLLLGRERRDLNRRRHEVLRRSAEVSPSDSDELDVGDLFLLRDGPGRLESTTVISSSLLSRISTEESSDTSITSMGAAVEEEATPSLRR